MKKPDFRLLLLLTCLTVQLAWYAMLWSGMILHPDLYKPTDFSIFYTAGRIAASGHYDQLYDLETQRQVRETFLGFQIQVEQVLPFNHPPLLVPILQLITSGNYMAAYWWWVLVMIGFLAAALVTINQLLRGMGWERGVRAVVLVACLLFYPIFAGFLKGQDTAFLLFGAALWVYGILAKKDLPAGVGLALTVIRPQIALMLAVPFLFKRRKVLVWFCAGAAVLCLYSLLLVGTNGVRDFLHLLAISASGEDYNMFQNAMFNFTGLVLRLFPQANLNLVHGIAWGLFLAAIAGLSVLWKLSPEIRLRHLALALAVSLFVAPHLHYHDLALLLIPTVCLMAAWTPSGKSRVGYATFLPLIVSLCLMFADLWNPLRLAVPYLLMAALPALTWVMERRHETG